MRGYSFFLNQYYKFQDRILLVYRESPQSSWSDRCFFLDENYSPHKAYNHRSILRQEVVLEFDEESPEDNKTLTGWATEALRKDNINYMQWTSGNKSQHVHFFLDVKEGRNLPLLKNCFLRHYGTFYRDEGGQIKKDKPESNFKKVLPDLRLCSDNHLIRCENGLHEKTGKYKSFVYKNGKYPELNKVPEAVWIRYQQQQIAIARRHLSPDIDDTVLKEKIKIILSSEKMRSFEDGRERALFILIHYLKQEYQEKKEDLIRYLIDWYRYSGGFKLSESDIKSKVHYHWNRTYSLERMLNELLETLT